MRSREVIRRGHMLPILLMVAFVLPGVGCGGDAIKNLTAAGKFDIAMETATGVMEELTIQAGYVVEDRRAGVIDQHEAERRYDALRSSQQALGGAAELARVAFESGDDPALLTTDLNAAIGAARAVIRREGR